MRTQAPERGATAAHSAVDQCPLSALDPSRYSATAQTDQRESRVAVRVRPSEHRPLREIDNDSWSAPDWGSVEIAHGRNACTPGITRREHGAWVTYPACPATITQGTSESCKHRGVGIELRRWRVAAGIIEVDGRVLLVENLRRNGLTDWSTPGGVVELGEHPVAGLTREVAEETGLQVTEWSGPIYTVVTIAEGMGWHLDVEVHRAVSWEGNVATGADPDGIVITAEFCEPHEARANLAGTAQWVSEPMLAYLDERWEGSRSFEYRLEGADRSKINVVRLHDAP